MSEWIEVIKLCIEYRPFEFYSLCALAVVMIPLAAFLTVAMAVIMIGKE